MNPFRFQDRKQLDHELGLQQRFTARNGNPALVAEIIPIAERARRNVFRRMFFPAVPPSIGVVAVLTAKRTALQKYYEPNPRPVYRTKGFK